MDKANMLREIYVFYKTPIQSVNLLNFLIIEVGQELAFTDLRKVRKSNRTTVKLFRELIKETTKESHNGKKKK
ncbi:hypothetical protein JHD46_05335 [Sulfurimonas sp. SAG-AH-194-C20]|nr:hypothetical protein [Sulfurimonas sp. SAG-AH-194-C20]MDF1879062.1 hypothetical protein [Sulfurimonas sp. SAG-AH-194-C20]